MNHPQSINHLLFSAASSFTEEEERQAFLEFACRDEPDRLRRIRILLDAEEDAERFFDAQPTLVDDSDPLADDLQQSGGLGARIGPYKLVDRIGSGGCGAVYLAERLTPPKRKVALKIIRLGRDSEGAAMHFEVERRALSMMDHPYIAKVLDGGTTISGRPYFVMELVDGEKITDFSNRKRLGLQDRLGLFIKVCEAIQHAHQKGVVHRDITPANILVCESGGESFPKIIDFGIATAAKENSGVDPLGSRSKDFIGTPCYMSPEQSIGGLDVDTRSDIYSLGALLWELLTGQPPFPASRFNDCGVDEIRNIIQQEEPGIPSNQLRNLSKELLGAVAEERSTDPQRLPSLLAGDLDWIMMKATEKNRQRRYETVNGLALDVRRHLDEQPVTARPPSRRYLLAKLIRRNRIVFAAILVALSGLISGMGLSTWLFLRERTARQEQARLRVEAEKARSAETQYRKRALAAERLTQAAVLYRYGQAAEADALVSQLPPELVPPSLEAADTLLALAEWNMMNSRWSASAERFSALAPVVTSVDLSDTDRMSRSLMPAATAIKEWGAPAQYRHLREVALDRFGDTSHEGVAAQVAKAVMLEPADPQTLGRIRKIESVMRSALDDPESATPDYLKTWRAFSMGLLAYRQDHLEDAERWLQRSLAIKVRTAQLTISNQIVLGMIHIRRKQPDLARPLLDEAQKVLRKWERAPFKIGTADDLWFDWVNARILLREAKAMAGAPR